MLAHQVLVVDALEEGMGLDLVDGGGDLVVDDQVEQPVGVEVGDTYRLRCACAVEGFHGAPLSVDIAEGLVHQVQVEVVQTQPGQRGLERALGVVLGGCVLDPQLGGDEQILAGDAAGLDGATDGFFVVVGGGSVQQAIAGGESVGDGALGVLGGDLVDAEAEQRHRDAVVEGGGLHERDILSCAGRSQGRMRALRTWRSAMLR